MKQGDSSGERSQILWIFIFREHLQSTEEAGVKVSAVPEVPHTDFLDVESP